VDFDLGQRWREEREKELAKRWADDTEGRATAAYLASLELLASHYRHQALANAKVWNCKSIECLRLRMGYMQNL